MWIHMWIRRAVRSARTGAIYPETAGKRRANLLNVQRLPCDIAGLKHILGKRPKRRFLSKVGTQRRHAAKKTPLPIPYGSQQVGQCLLIPVEQGPIRALMQVYSTHNLR